MLQQSLMNSKEIYESYELIQKSSRCPYCGSYEIIKYGYDTTELGKNRPANARTVAKDSVSMTGFQG